MSSYCFFICLLVFFLSSSKATKFRSARKKQLEDDFKEGIAQLNIFKPECVEKVLQFNIPQVVKEIGFKCFVMVEWQQS